MGKLSIYPIAEYLRTTDYLVGLNDNGELKQFKAEFFLRTLPNESAFLSLVDSEADLRMYGDQLLDDKIELYNIQLGARIDTNAANISTLGSNVNAWLYGAGGIEQSYQAADAALYAYIDSEIAGVEFTLPQASSTVLGGVKIGSGLSIDPLTGIVTVDEQVGTGFDETSNYEPSGTWDFTGNLRYNSVNVATENFVTGQGYTTQSWVEGQNYTTQSYIASLGHATQSWVISQDYATKSWVYDNVVGSGWTDLFELVDAGTYQYIRAKFSLASVGDIISYEDGGDAPSNIWDSMPLATSTSIGGIKAYSTYTNGVRINASGFLEVDPAYAGTGFDETANYTPSGTWNFTGTLNKGGVAVATETYVSTNYEPAFSKNTAFNKNFGTTSTTVAYGNHLHTGVYEPVFTKNTGFNKNFGTTSGTVSEGNHLHTGVYLPIGGSTSALVAVRELRIYDDTNVLQWTLKNNNTTDDIEFYNASGVLEAKLSQSGTLTSRGDVVAFGII